MRKPEGFAAFSVIWVGQILSAVGTRMTAFALGLFIWDRTGQVTAYAILSFCSFAATVAFSPLAGGLVDRWNRRLTIVLSDVGSIVMTSGLLLLFTLTTVHLWMLYVVATVTGAFLAFQYPAYSATISTMMKRGQYPRANAMMSLITSLPAVAAPALAAVLLTVSNIRVILGIDAASYLIAIGTVFLVALPARPAPSAGAAGEDAPRSGIWHDSLFGFRYIWRSRPLTSLLTYSFTIGLIAGITYTVMLPLVLARTGNDSLDGGLIQSVGAAGGVLGGIAVAALGARSDKIKYILGATVLLGLFGRTLYGLSDTILLWCVGQLIAWGSLPAINGYTQTIWQENVPLGAQGRVFAAQNFVENLSLPVGLALSGVLADQVFGPGMEHGGFLARVFGGLVGKGPGAGMSVMCIIGGVLLILTAAAAYFTPAIRDADRNEPEAVAAAVGSAGDQRLAN